MKAKLALLVLGLLGGLAGGYVGRPAVDRLVGTSNEVEGVIVDERREEDRLVLTLRAGEETVLASFRDRADDVEGLVAPGDFLTVRLGRRGVFADEVPIVRLRRAADIAAEESARRSRRRRRGERRDDEAEATGAAGEPAMPSTPPPAPPGAPEPAAVVEVPLATHEGPLVGETAAGRDG